ncbi:hypothetical protein [Pseudomonas phage vB_Pae_SG_WM_SEW_P16]|uniref:Uncharacterized protein n=1 Tax=Pseudomonas phage vB_PaeM_PE1 TaxID=3161145 RepID=A0AAU8EIZ9_9CAUD|nr:hypothetical protein APTCPA18_CDS65 [Pseudomonas phage APTC-PA18]
MNTCCFCVRVKNFANINKFPGVWTFPKEKYLEKFRRKVFPSSISLEIILSQANKPSFQTFPE